MADTPILAPPTMPVPPAVPQRENQATFELLADGFWLYAAMSLPDAMTAMAANVQNNAQAALEQAQHAQDWSSGTAPGGAGTKSAREQADAAAASAASAVSAAQAAGVSAGLPSPTPANKVLGTSAAGAVQWQDPASSGLPAGVVLPYGGSTVPAGFLMCDGTAVSRTTYAALFAAIGTTHGAGDGSTTFNLPDTRGVVIRGFDAGRGQDPGRVFGTYQADAFRSHNHTGSTASAGNHAHSAATASAGGHFHAFNGFTGNWAAIAAAGTGTLVPVMQSGQKTGTVSGHTHTVTVDAGGTHTHPVTIDSYGGTETRMKNIALNHIIKT